MEFVFGADATGMTWFRPDYPYAQVRLNARVSGAVVSQVHNEHDGDRLRTRITLTNTGASSITTAAGDIAITLPLQDRYDGGADQLTHRCHAHLLCAGTASRVLALRMNGQGPHLGLVLTEGALTGYSIERDLTRISNDRGCFLLHPEPLDLAPGERAEVAWTIFPVDSAEDFADAAAEHTRFLEVAWDRPVSFAGEGVTCEVTPSFPVPRVLVGDEVVMPDGEGRFRIRLTPARLGEQELVVRAAEQWLRTRIVVKEPLPVLLERRCRFIATRQQAGTGEGALAGAFLTFDNETGRRFYDPENDYNAGRERVGMGVLIARYLRALATGRVHATESDTAAMLRASLAEFAGFMRRELVDETTGEAFNDAGRGGETRLYNAPWYAQFFLALHLLEGRIEDLELAARIVLRYYELGGADFYPIELPALEVTDALRRAGLEKVRGAVAREVVTHAERIAIRGTNFPTSEVNYEQSIVAPALDILLQAHQISGRGEFLAAARESMPVLEAFAVASPDFHLHEVAIRHWDGYWFGKRRRYGDTFPHYWSALSGEVYARYAEVTGEVGYAQRAEASVRGVLPLIFDDGRASCAYLFPHSINGEAGEFFDPYANDQDWALIFALRHFPGRF